MEGGHYKNKDIHGKPENAGPANMVKASANQLKTDVIGITQDIMEAYRTGITNKGTYRGQYTDEQLLEESFKFIKWCADQEVKPTKPLYSLWLGVSKETVNRWGRNSKYGAKHEIVQQLFTLMEAYLQADINKHPTGNIFLLKTSHGHVESSKVDVTTNGEKADEGEVLDMVKRLGLDKPDNN